MDNSKQAQLLDILKNEPAFRQKQIEKAWFDPRINSYEEITTLPFELRQKLKDIPWLTLNLHTHLISQLDNTQKLLFKLYDENYIETVVMGRKNLKQEAKEYVEKEGRKSDRYTICVSSQAGCPMGCVFCATGKSGFKRHLTAEEIIDQYRFCQRLLAPEGAKIQNIVMMGQGEPLLNYDNVKRALSVILKNTEVGETKITVSTAGVIPAMERLIEDPAFPPVRWALSLHSAIEETRKKIMPSHQPGFLDFLVSWALAYDKKFPSRTHFIGLEYIMLGGVNDDEKHLQALIKLCKKMPKVRINIIPFNEVTDENIASFPLQPEEGREVMRVSLKRSPQDRIEHWHEEIMKAGFTSTIRYSQGQDIAAACGQLRNKVQ